MNNLIKQISIVSLIFLFAACDGKKSQDQFGLNNTGSTKTTTDAMSAQTSEISGGGGGYKSSASAVNSMAFSARPSLKVDRIGSYVGNKITISANYYRYMPNYENNLSASWQIVDADGTEVLNQEGFHLLEWTPTTAGTYTVKHTMTENNVELIVSEVLYVLNEINQETDITDRFWAVDEKLLGTWSGEINSRYGEKIPVTVIFYNDGTYLLSRITRNSMSAPYTLYEPDFDGAFPMPASSSPPGAGGGGSGMGGMNYNDSIHFANSYPPLEMPGFNVGFEKEKGIYELLDVWENGEALGYMQPKDYPAYDSENMKRIRFTDDYETLFFELSTEPFFSDNKITFILSRVSDAIEPPDLSVINEKVIGEWRGSVITPWAVPYEVTFHFQQDGTYQAISNTNTALFDGEALGRVSALYFGAVEPTNGTMHYNLDSFANDVAAGEIALELKNGDIVTGTITNLEMSIDYSILVFTFSHYGKYGPIQYVLERQ